MSTEELLQTVLVHPISFHAFLGPYNGVYLRQVYTVHNGSMVANKYQSAEEWLYSDGMYRTRYLDEVSPQAQTYLNNYVYGSYGLTPVSGYGPTVNYNCHSYAWANT